MMHRIPAAALGSAALALALFAAAPAAASVPGLRLVVVITVDQLRPERIGSEFSGGLGRLVRQGRVFPDAVHDHALTETCPGHATILTGRYPAKAGIPGNSFFDPERSRVVYCAEDPSPDAAVLGARPPGEGKVGGRSPRLLRVDALGDWLQAADPRSRVFSVAGKDRAAIMLGGQRPDGAWWFERKGEHLFTTSRYYQQSLPPWITAFNDPATGFLAGIPEVWEHGSEGGVRADDFAGEADRHSRTSPHPLRQGDPAELTERLFSSPFLDEATLALALTLVQREDLGLDDVPDLLAIGLSATDVVGHLYGPYSLESQDALRRLDLALLAFLEALEKRVGSDGLLVVLTSDHGVLPLPEWLEARGEALCPVKGGRVGIDGIGLRLLARLHLSFSPLRWPRPWLLFAGGQIAVDGPLAAERRVPSQEVALAAKRYLEEKPGVAHVWTASEIHAGGSELARLYRNSFDPERSGDLVVQVAEGCLISRYDAGTTHGSPYLYDRAVPLVFWGAGVERGTAPGVARTIDIAPTLAAALGLRAPSRLDGRPLF
jgi:hypothetical protein